MVDFLMQRHECRTFVLDTLFDFFGCPQQLRRFESHRDDEQTPLLQKVRERNYSGLVTGACARVRRMQYSRETRGSFWRSHGLDRAASHADDDSDAESGSKQFPDGPWRLRDRGILKEDCCGLMKRPRSESWRSV